jgi:hypothetical protein
MTSRRTPLAALVAALLLVVAGCGGDDDTADKPASKPRAPEQRADSGDRRKDGTASEPHGASGGAGSGGSAPPSGAGPGSDGDSGSRTGGVPAEPPADRPGNDLPPPPGSPAERFEEQCPKGPDSC